MAKTTDPTTIIVVDDELHNIIWLIDFINGNGLKVKTATNVNEATKLLDSGINRAVIVDLNIPVIEPLTKAVNDKGVVYTKFPGLYIANLARNKGYRDRQVVIYSVHKDPAVADEAKKLGCTYILKGRPREIKTELERVLSYDPTIDAKS